ncbi:MAG: acyl-CoA synthetase [Gammaproteobacteria bacterium]|nr:acyl-CoA synthetase [Gammaproteobacteria bacterium]
MSSHDSPLICRAAKDPIAHINTKLAPLGELNGTISAQQFLCHVRQLAKQLPTQHYAINLCDNRYLFMVALCAVIVRQQTNLLAPNAHCATQEKLNQRYKNSYVLHDGGIKTADNIPQFDLSNILLTNHSSDFDIPLVSLDHLAVISFTSGSTGNSKSNHKTWHTLVTSTAINQRYMLPNADQTFYQLATVPGQHMWGLETSVLLALRANVCSSDTRPLYPYDVYQQLAALPSPRMLVSTPVHLRALVDKNTEQSKLDIILCATAPLNQALACDVERLFSTELREIYGCSEIGSMAIKKTAQEENWQRFAGISFKHNEKSLISASAEHITHSVELNDQIELLDQTHFKLTGRSSDTINIAGKRGSLYEINNLLLDFPGLLDGVVFLPPQKQRVPRLAAIVVLNNEASRQQLVNYLRQYLDSAFIPRPLIEVEALPREKNGKLPQSQLLTFFESLRKNPSSLVN